MPLRRRQFVRLGCLLGGSSLVGGAPSFGDDEPKPSGAKPTMEALWLDLEKDEEPATRALLKMTDRREEATKFLAERLQPLRVDPDWLEVRLVRLGSKDPEVWKPAFEELEYFDPRLAKELETLMKEVTDTPARQRLTEVLSGREAGSLEEKTITLRPLGGGGDGFNFFDGRASWWAEHKIARLSGSGWGNPKKKWNRAVRAIMLLEHFATPKARAILKAMSSGEPDAQPTRVAREALARLS